MRVSEAERKQVHEAVVAAEQSCALEFVCVLARRASAYPFYPLAWSAVLGLLTPWALLWLTPWPFDRILLGQLVVFAAAMGVLSWPPIRTRLVPRSVQRRAAYRAAVEQFLVRGLARTPNRCGVLLYVAEDERYARVLADDGADALLDKAVWQGAVDRLIEGSKAGRHAEGFRQALDHCRSHAAAVAPRTTPSENVLPDRFVVLD